MSENKTSDKQKTPRTDALRSKAGVSSMHYMLDEVLASHEQLEREVAALRLLEGMDALEVSALGTFLKGGDIPNTIDAARGVLVRRALEAEKALSATLQIPEGWKLVPNELTDEMFEAASQECSTPADDLRNAYIAAIDAALSYVNSLSPKDAK